MSVFGWTHTQTAVSVSLSLGRQTEKVFDTSSPSAKLGINVYNAMTIDGCVVQEGRQKEEEETKKTKRTMSK